MVHGNVDHALSGVTAAAITAVSAASMVVGVPRGTPSDTSTAANLAANDGADLSTLAMKLRMASSSFASSSFAAPAVDKTQRRAIVIAKPSAGASQVTMSAPGPEVAGPAVAITAFSSSSSSSSSPAPSPSSSSAASRAEPMRSIATPLAPAGMAAPGRYALASATVDRTGPAGSGGAGGASPPQPMSRLCS